ncbi:MAG: hypothetical protein E5W15_07845 [Mesorhizobium sp.]|nr:hypothetical protein EJ068_00330 [Mesorhizobium sp. M2A.F.Ca.ET.043.02.1.1]RUW43038.1 hypothetical protein EOA37_02490 [Mesorhizobium sp. M2A.F.Ca.ET.015.02.1.1]RUW70188.1 hypothetical protein EOA28_24195 [Mesorhizobium sp. M2A.F.Ca.ET.067.02.1.1]RVC92525.1 hypothetical protein EN739_25215 [Mesorhizobium sp. M2A.F.Ca.ET.017.03.2.1]RVD08376.1 hypothetical protein EN753_14370 [Mesorhizobium sp. M2A.F.Ca.ET.029.05.1.1]RWB47627.1 MAG: hypothetical protein EOQ46_06240 [Mesorhizobium sp.]
MSLGPLPSAPPPIPWHAFAAFAALAIHPSPAVTFIERDTCEGFGRRRPVLGTRHFLRGLT